MTPQHPNRNIIVFTVMLVATLEVLDSTIVNVALPSMMGSLGANAEQITWVLTSYIVASAIFMPLTGFLVDRLGRKRLLLINISGFMLSSMLCGIATSLDAMITFRLAQGAFGAALIPISQAIVRNAFPLNEQGKAMAIWGIGIMVAPILGPTIGGYVIEHANWRWLFYLNIPTCAVSLFLAYWFIPETVRIKRAIDWLGLTLMAAGIGSLQIFLDQGNQQDWFSSNFIKIILFTSISCLAIFCIRCLKNRNNIINLKLFKDKNFALSTIMLAVFTGGMFAVLATQPLMLQTLLNYPTITTGLVMMPRGIATALGMAFAALLMRRFDSRFIIAAGIILTAYGTFIMSHFNLDISISVIIWPGLFQGFGMGLFFVPLSATALISLSENTISEAAGLFSYGRLLGTSIGISILSTIITKESQINWHQLGGFLRMSNPNFIHWLQTQHLSMYNPEAMQQLALLVSKHARMIAFIDGYWIIAIAFVVLLPFVFFLKGTGHESRTPKME